MDEEQKQTPAAPAEFYDETDVFLWANNLVQIKEELEIDLFLFNKNFTVYKTQLAKDLRNTLEPLLIDPLIETVLDGAEQGMVVRGFEEAEQEKNVLQRAPLGKVDNLKMVLNWLKTQEHEIETFVEQEHDFKRIKGLVARCRHKDLPKPFYVIKALPQSVIMKGAAGWMLRNGKFVQFDAEGALRIPPDNHLLVLDQDIYVFNQAKLSGLFGYDAKKYTIAEQKMKLVAENFQLKIDESQNIEEMVKGKKALINKLQKLDPTIMKQQDLVDHAEELGLPLMTDDSGAVIIMDGKDLSTFVNLLNDDYIESPVTGLRYEIKSKRPLKPDDDDDLLREVL